MHVSNGTEASARRNEMVVWLHAGQLADAADGQRQRRRRLRDGRLPVLEIVKRKLQGSDAVAEIPADALLHVVVVVVVVVIDVTVVKIKVVVTLHREEGVRRTVRVFLADGIFLNLEEMEMLETFRLNGFYRDHIRPTFLECFIAAKKIKASIASVETRVSRNSSNGNLIVKILSIAA